MDKPAATEQYEVGTAAEVLAAAAVNPVALVRRLCTIRYGSPHREKLIALLVRQGPDAAAALREAFPGPLDGTGAALELPIEKRGPVLAALAALGSVATPYVVHLMLDPDPGRRRLAAELLGYMRDPAAFLPLAERVLDVDSGVAGAALAALVAVRSHPDIRPVQDRLRRALLGGEADRAAQAALALARLGDEQAIPLLIQELEGPREVSNAAAVALEILTCRRFGPDVDAWVAWWREHRSQRRIDWFFTALVDDDRAVRITAAESLRAAGNPPIDWSPDASALERIEAARLWRAWWETHQKTL